MNVTPKLAIELVKDTLRAGLCPMLHGSPGTGKSDIVKSICKEYKLFLIDLRLSQCDSVDLNGFPVINEKKTRGHYAPLDSFPLEGDKVPTGYNGWLLFCDEISSAALSVQAAAYRLILDREVGHNKLHKDVYIVAAGNLATDKAIVNRMGTAMQSRLIHLNLEVNVEDWLDWANTNKIDYRITSFIKFKPNLLHNFNPNHKDNTFSCPRTWYFLHKIINPWEKIEPTKMPLLVGTIGEGVAYEFLSFTQVMESLPSIETIIAQAEILPIPDAPDVLYAITGMVGHHINEANSKQLIKFISRLPMEFQIICLQDVFKKNKEIKAVPEIRNWIKTNAPILASRGVF